MKPNVEVVDIEFTMDTIPDMDDLLNELEASENDYCTKSKNSGNLLANNTDVVRSSEKSKESIDPFHVDHTAAQHISEKLRNNSEAWRVDQRTTEVHIKPQSYTDNITVEPVKATEVPTTYDVVPEKRDLAAVVTKPIETVQNVPLAGFRDLSDDVINSLSSSESNDLPITCENMDSTHDLVIGSESTESIYQVEIKQKKHAVEQNHEIQDSTSEQQIPMNVADTMDVCKEDKMKIDLCEGSETYSKLSVTACNADAFEKIPDMTFGEMDNLAEQYSEMEQYLARCGTDDSSDVFDQSNMQDNLMTLCTFHDDQVTKLEKTNEDEEMCSESGVIHEADSDCSPELASKLQTDWKGKCYNEAMVNIESDALFPCSRTVEQSMDESINGAVVNFENDSGPVTKVESISCGVSDNTTSIEQPRSLRCLHDATFSQEMSGSAEDKTKETEDGNNAANEEGVEVGLVENSDESTGECEIPMAEVEEMRTVSVVTGTYDMSLDSGVKYLTESERQLGKAKPIWIADKETPSCMLCCTKFTVFLRRHHCRCCGRVLCAHCTTQKVALPYANDPTKEHRVCDPCFETLKRIEEYEKNLQSCERNTNEYVPSTGGNLETYRVAKPALKSKTKPDLSNVINDQVQSTSDATYGTAVKRSVTFPDGVHPGESPVDKVDTPNVGASSLKLRKHGSKKQQVSRKLKELHIAEECVCFLPGAGSTNCTNGVNDTNDLNKSSKNNHIFLRDRDGKIMECSGIQEQIRLQHFEPIDVLIFRNLWCTIKLCEYEKKAVMCVASRGMSFVGLDEIFIAYYCNAESAELPTDYLWRIYEIYQNALTPQNESQDEELGIRPAYTRIPTLNRTTCFSDSGKPVARDILLFRPSVQNFDNLLVPSSPFMVAAFIYESESIWANVIPQRLLFRLGLQASFYPTPVVNDFEREPVYSSIYDTSVLKMFNDFRNWRFRMPFIAGSTMMVRDNNESFLSIPTYANDEIVKIIRANKNMLAWGLDFDGDADSYLVCKQDEAGCFDSQIFTNGIENRRVTGASFVVIDGALKNGDETLTVNVLEDGIAIRLRSDIMELLIEALSASQDFEHSSSAMKFSIKWQDPQARQFPGELVSPIDGRSLTGCYEYGLQKSRILASSYPFPGNKDWSLRLVCVYNIVKGRFPELIHSKVFAVSEQIAAQIALTLVPFVGVLIDHDHRQISFRFRISADDAEYKTQPWPGMEEEFATWSDLLDNQIAPGLFTICSYITFEFHAELTLALISIRANP